MKINTDSYFKIEENMKLLLADKEFSAGVKFDLGKKVSRLEDRISILKRLASNKKILHIGCCDHQDLIDDKIKKNTWLHKILDECSESATGIDIDKAAISYINQNYPQYDVRYCNISIAEKADWLTESYDYVLLPETLEHVPDPQQFLQAIHKNLCGAKRMVVTVPNSFRSRNRACRLRYERINSNHYFWFTPYTAAKLLTKAGFDVEWFYYGLVNPWKHTINPIKFARYTYLKNNPSAIDILFLCCKF